MQNLRVAEAALILRFLDPRTGNDVRLYKCECGERILEE